MFVIINSLKVPKIKKILLYEIKFLVPNYSCLQNPWLGGYRPQIPVLSVLCLQLNLLNPPPRTKFLGTPLFDVIITKIKCNCFMQFLQSTSINSLRTLTEASVQWSFNTFCMKQGLTFCIQCVSKLLGQIWGVISSHKTKGTCSLSMFILEQFSKYIQSTCSAQSFGFLTVGSLKNYRVFTSKGKLKRHFTNAFWCLSHHFAAVPGLWKGVTVHCETCLCVYWFRWSTFGRSSVNFDFINIKNSAVSKLKIFTVNELPVNAKKPKVIRLQVWKGSEVSRSLTFPDFMTVGTWCL